jgi:hypothetical protein
MSISTVRFSDRKTANFGIFSVRFPDTFIDIYAIGRAFLGFSVSLLQALEAGTS